MPSWENLALSAVRCCIHKYRDVIPASTRAYQVPQTIPLVLGLGDTEWDTREQHLDYAGSRGNTVTKAGITRAPVFFNPSHPSHPSFEQRIVEKCAHGISVLAEEAMYN